MSNTIGDWSDHQMQAYESYPRIFTKKIRGLDLSNGIAVLTDAVLWKPQVGDIFLLKSCISKCTRVSGTVSAARIELEANNVDVVAAVAPAVVLDTATEHTVIGTVVFTNAKPLALTTIVAGSASAILNLELILTAIRLNDIYGN